MTQISNKFKKYRSRSSTLVGSPEVAAMKAKYNARKRTAAEAQTSGGSDETSVPEAMVKIQRVQVSFIYVLVLVL
jgi:hypothetical protein